MTIVLQSREIEVGQAFATTSTANDSIAKVELKGLVQS